MTTWPWLSVLTFSPLAGVAAVLAAGHHPGRARRLALISSAFSCGLVLLILARFDPQSETLSLIERAAWIPSLGVYYHLGIDGLGAVVVLLTAVVTWMSVAASAPDRPRVYYALILCLQTGLFGAFTAQNFFHWFLFYEASLVPAWFLVKLWGGERRNQAAFQFFVYTMLGSVALLLAFSALFLGAGTFEFNELAAQAHAGLLFPKLTQALHWPASAPTLGWLLFALAFLGFAVKVPLVPFHSWLPATYQQAEAPVTMLLTGVMSKLGVYGFLRIVQPIFPEALATLQVPLLGLAVFSVVFAAGAALAQTDLKRVLAWSSVNHLGYCLLAFFALSTDGPPADRAAALSGIILQIFNHGLTAAALFWGAHLLERRTGTLEFARLGGLRAPAPVFCGLLGIAIFSSLGLPGLNGFIGEFLIFKGVFALTPWAGACAVLGLLITAVFLLQALQKVFYGPVPDHLARVPDLSIAERLHWAPVIGLMLGLGIYPQALLWLLQGTLNAWTTK